MILTEAFCNGSDAVECPAAKAGLYDIDKSHNVLQNITQEPGLVFQWGSEMALNISGSATTLSMS